MEGSLRGRNVMLWDFSQTRNDMFRRCCSE